MLVVKLEAPSLPQGWLLHSDSAPLAVIPLPPLLLPRAAAMIDVCWSNTPTWMQKTERGSQHRRAIIKKVDCSFC